MVKWTMMREEKEGKKNGKYKRYSRCKMYGQTPCQNGEVKVYRYTDGHVQSQVDAQRQLTPDLRCSE